MIGTIVQLEKWFERTCYGAGHAIDILLRAVASLRFIGKRRKDIFSETFSATFGAMPVVFIVAFFTGMILAIQSGNQLRQFGQEGAIGFLVAKAMVLEMGPVFTAIALAGLVGSTYAAAIGTMKVNEEIDALEVQSIDPVYFLAMPRIIALFFTTIILTTYADLIGIFGGALVGDAIFRVELTTYFNNAKEVLTFKDIWGGMLKSAIFALTIASIACSQGMRAMHGAAGVGRATMRSVVLSMICILVFDYIISWILL